MIDRRYVKIFRRWHAPLRFTLVRVEKDIPIFSQNDCTSKQRFIHFLGFC